MSAAQGEVRALYELSDAHREQLFAFYFDAWWCRSRTREQVEAALAASCVVVLADERGDLVGFARIVTDGAIYAYLGDVMVRHDLRGAGLGARLVDAVLAHPGVAPTAKWELTCRPELDDFYARWDFVDPAPSHVLRRAATAGAATGGAVSGGAQSPADR